LSFSVSLITAVVIWITDSNSTGGYLNMSPKERERYEKNPCVPQIMEREKLLSGDGSTSDLSGDDLLQPQSDTRMRNRYLTRIGAEVTDDELQA
jgi:hypothetical protein